MLTSKLIKRSIVGSILLFLVLLLYIFIYILFFILSKNYYLHQYKNGFNQIPLPPNSTQIGNTYGYYGRLLGPNDSCDYLVARLFSSNETRSEIFSFYKDKEFTRAQNRKTDQSNNQLTSKILLRVVKVTDTFNHSNNNLVTLEGKLSPLVGVFYNHNLKAVKDNWYIVYAYDGQYPDVIDPRCS